MFLNISAGLCLIPLAKQMMKDELVAFSASAIAVFVALSGVFNGCGRFVFAFISDKLPKRLAIILLILGISILTMGCTLVSPMAIGVSLLLINACYGAGFSVIPAILSEKFGMTDISKIHGAVLSAWGVAGLCGNQLSLLMNRLSGFRGVIVMIACLYLVNLLNYLYWRKKA